MFFSPFNIAITSLGEERTNLSVFCMFVQFALVCICRFPLPLGVWEGLRFMIVALSGFFSYLFSGKHQAALLPLALRNIALTSQLHVLCLLRVAMAIHGVTYPNKYLRNQTKQRKGSVRYDYSL